MKQWTLALLVAASCGCTAIVDGAIRDAVDGGGPEMDAQVGDDCTGATDGTACGDGHICIDEVCEISECGDGVVDPTSEDCDDENDVALDGCEDDCSFTCESAADCDDQLPCNGAEQCDATHVCMQGTALGDGAGCTQPSGEAGVCRGTDCVAAGCGNTLIDGTEECDDGNANDGDGCDSDCTFSCHSDEECDDLSVCSGTETCDLTEHTCVSGTVMSCDDGSPCTSNDCDPMMGCVFPLIDMDGDGYASQTLGACGTDCNDMRDDVNPGAAELCGDALDSDCDGNVNPASTPVWYRDCDDDGYAVVGAVTMTSCTEPPGVAGCTGWTTRVPISGNRSTFDCNDGNANVRPNQTGWFGTAISGVSTSIDYDYDCDVSEERRYTATGVSTTASCAPFLFGCSGASGWTGTTAPACGASAAASLCVAGRDGTCVRIRDSSYQQTCH